jgi:hypothetical protein
MPQEQKQTSTAATSTTTTTTTISTKTYNSSSFSPNDIAKLSVPSNTRKTLTTYTHASPENTPTSQCITVTDNAKNIECLYSSINSNNVKPSNNAYNNSTLFPSYTQTQTETPSLSTNNVGPMTRQKAHYPLIDNQNSLSQSPAPTSKSNLSSSLSTKATPVNLSTPPTTPLPKDDYDISDILARYNISKQSLEKPRKIKLRKDSETNIKNIIESIDTKLEKINKCTAPQAAAAVVNAAVSSSSSSGALIVDTCNYDMQQSQHHIHYPIDGSTIFDLSCINGDSIHNDGEINRFMMPPTSPLSPTSMSNMIVCSSPGCIHHQDYYTNCARYPLIARAVGGKHICLTCQANMRNFNEPPPPPPQQLRVNNLQNISTNTTNRSFTARRRSGSEYSMPSVELSPLESHPHHPHPHQSHARTLSANRADDLSHNYYMHESSTPRTIDHHISLMTNNTSNEQKNGAKNRGIKKSNSLRAGSFYSRFDELIKNTCELVSNPFESGSIYRYDMDDCVEKARVANQSRYFRSHYDKSLLAYADGITHSLSSASGLFKAKNDSHNAIGSDENGDQNEITDDLIENIHRVETMPSHSKLDQNTSNEEMTTNTNTNTNANLTISNEAHREEDTSNSSFFEVSKKSHNASADSTLEVETDYCNESFII